MLSISRFLYLATLVFAPLAFGSVESWAFFFLTLLTGAAIGFYLLHTRRHAAPIYRVPCMLPLALLGLFILFQIIPLPQAVLSFLSPNAAQLRNETIGILLPGRAWPLTLNLHATLFELCRWLLWVGFYWISVQLLSDKAMLRRTLLFLAFFAGIFAFSSILQYIFTDNRALWFRYISMPSIRVIGSYINRNHYAGLMAMLFGPTLGLLLALRPPRQFGTMREKILGLFEEKETPLFILLLLSASIMVMSVFISLSRGGMISLCISSLFFLLMASGKKFSGRHTKIKITAAMLLCAVLMALTWVGWETIDNRFSTIYAADDIMRISRLRYWGVCLAGGLDFLTTGVGFGAFEVAGPIYQTYYLGAILDHAHNDYLELLIEGGIPGVLLFFVFFLCLFQIVQKTLKKRKESYSILICIGAITGIVAILLHSFTDFNLHIPANALYLAFLCGLAVAAAHTRLREHITPPTFLPPASNRAALVTPFLFILLWPPLLALSMGQWMADQHTRPFIKQPLNNTTAPALLEQAAESARRATAFSPWNATAHTLLGDAAFFSGNPSQALKAYQQVLCFTPTRSTLLQKAGQAARNAGLTLSQAEALMAAGVKTYPMRPGAHGAHAGFLFETGNKKKAMSVVRTGIETHPSQAQQFFTLMNYAGLTPAEMFTALPANSYVLTQFAAHIQNTDYDFMRRTILTAAVNAADQEADPSPGAYITMAHLYLREKNYDQAITVLERGVTRLPDYPYLLYLLARTYEENQIAYKALDLYKKLQIVSPGYRDTEQRLKAMKR